jgi:hypothetical protein
VIHSFFTKPGIHHNTAAQSRGASSPVRRLPPELIRIPLTVFFACSSLPQMNIVASTPELRIDHQGTANRIESLHRRASANSSADAQQRLAK